MTLSVVVAFEMDEDEGKQDAVNQWVVEWLEGIDIWLWMEKTYSCQVVEVVDSVNNTTSEQDQAESAFVEMVVKGQASALWDDGDRGGPSGGRC